MSRVDLVQEREQTVTWDQRMAGPNHPDSSARGIGLPSAINRPVPPPPPPLTPTPPPRPGTRTVAGNSSSRTTPKNPAAEAHAFLKAYAPTLLGQAIQRILDASFAIATSPEVDTETREAFGRITIQDAAMMVAMIFMRSGRIISQSGQSKTTDADIVFLFNSSHPLLLLADKGGVPSLKASPSEKRRFLEQLCLEEEAEWTLASESLAALVGFRLLAIYDQLNGCPLTSPGALTARMRHALLKYLHTLVDCDGKITSQERNCIEYLKERTAELIQGGVNFAKCYPSAARRLCRSPFAKPVLVIEPYRSREQGTGLRQTSSQEAVQEILRELWQMTGLASVKEEINSHINTLKVSALRREAGLAEIKTTNHMVFTGNPGTGKTTVARQLARLYRELGVLSKGSLTEVDQSALVAGYLGQTAIKTKEVVDKAKGGVLFIDEAYALTSGKQEDSFGKEAIDTLLKYMEDYRDDLIVIVAGYEQPMKDFLSSNPGLKSRFNKFISFSDYSPQELKAIFIHTCQSSGYVVSEKLDHLLTAAFTRMTEEKPTNFGNGRTVRNLFDCAVVRQANRIVQIQEPSHEQLMELTPADLTENDICKVLQ